MSSNSVREFSPRLLAITEQPPAPLSTVFLLVLLLLLTLTILWAYFGKLDIVARAQGKLIPESRLQVVQPLDGGRVADIQVAEGELVHKGQTLILMDDEIAHADTERLSNERMMVWLQLRRVNAELQGHPLVYREKDNITLFKDVNAQYQQNLNTYNHRIAQQQAVIERILRELDSERALLKKLKQTLPIHMAEEKAIRALQQKGYANRMALMERERIRIEASRDLEAQKSKIYSLEAGLEEARQNKRQIESGYRKALTDEKIELKQRAEQLDNELAKINYHTRLLTLVSPAEGYVKDLATHTKGSVVPSGTVLLTIVPVDVPLQAEVLVEDIDAGFIHEGQKAKVKVSSYDFQRYGMIDAHVDHVSADSGQQQPPSAEEPSEQISGYKAILNLESQELAYNGKQYQVKTGMQVTAEINLGTRTVMDYIFSPVTKVVKEAGREH